MRTSSKIVLALLLASAPAAAAAQDGPIATSSADVDAQINAFLNHPVEPLDAAPGASPLDAEKPPVDRMPHGEVGVGIGTGGYRHVHAATVVPVGKAGTAAIAVGETRFNGRHGGEHKFQSLSIAVDLSAAAKPRAACERGKDHRADPWRRRLGGTEATAAACPREASR
jgi:hypothetical protein